MGSIVGTPAYMPPEQILGKRDQVGPASDVYALSAVLYELLTLEHYLGPIGDSFAELVAAVANRPPRDAESLADPVRGRVPRSLSRICRKGLAKEPAARFQSAHELEQVLQAWLEGNAPIVCPGTALQRLLARTSRWIDRHPSLGPALLLTAAGLLLMWAAAATALALRS